MARRVTGQGVAALLLLFGCCCWLHPADATWQDWGVTLLQQVNDFNTFNVRYVHVSSGAGTPSDPFRVYFENRYATAETFSQQFHRAETATKDILTGWTFEAVENYTWFDVQQGCHPRVYLYDDSNPNLQIMYNAQCPSRISFSLSTDGGETWEPGAGLDLANTGGGGIQDVVELDDGKLYFFYQGGGGEIHQCDSGTAVGNSRWWSPDKTTDKVVFEKTAGFTPGLVNGFTPTGKILKIEGLWTSFIVPQDDTGIMVAQTTDLKNGPWVFVKPYNDTLLGPCNEASIYDNGDGSYEILIDKKVGGVGRVFASKMTTPLYQSQSSAGSTTSSNATAASSSTANPTFPSPPKATPSLPTWKGPWFSGMLVVLAIVGFCVAAGVVFTVAAAVFSPVGFAGAVLPGIAVPASSAASSAAAAGGAAV